MIHITPQTSQQVLEQLFSSPVNTIFEMDFDHFEELVALIERNIPDGVSFDYFPVNPGTELYITYGPNHCVIIHNEVVTDN